LKKPRKKTYSKRYTPDTYFMKQLKELDARLGCRFREDLQRFVITWEKIWGQNDEIMIVSKPHFRQPDRRELLFLCEGDLHRGDMRDRLNKTASYFADYRKRQDKNVADDIRGATKDDSIQLRNTFRNVYNMPGKPAEFRRIEPKVKGKTFNELKSCATA